MNKKINLILIFSLMLMLVLTGCSTTKKTVVEDITVNPRPVKVGETAEIKVNINNYNIEKVEYMAKQGKIVNKTNRGLFANYKAKEAGKEKIELVLSNPHNSINASVSFDVVKANPSIEIKKIGFEDSSVQKAIGLEMKNYSNEDKVDVYKSLKENFETASKIEENIKLKYFTDTDFKAGETYYYWVKREGKLSKKASITLEGEKEELTVESIKFNGDDIKDLTNAIEIKDTKNIKIKVNDSNYIKSIYINGKSKTNFEVKNNILSIPFTADFFTGKEEIDIMLYSDNNFINKTLTIEKYKKFDFHIADKNNKGYDILYFGDTTEVSITNGRLEDIKEINWNIDNGSLKKISKGTVEITAPNEDKNIHISAEMIPKSKYHIKNTDSWKFDVAYQYKENYSLGNTPFMYSSLTKSYYDSIINDREFTNQDYEDNTKGDFNINEEIVLATKINEDNSYHEYNVQFVKEKSSANFTSNIFYEDNTEKRRLIKPDSGGNIYAVYSIQNKTLQFPDKITLEETEITLARNTVAYFKGNLFEISDPLAQQSLTTLSNNSQFKVVKRKLPVIQ